MQRKRLIKEVLGEGSLNDMARIIRDLSARQIDKKLNPTEEDALKRFKERLVREWAVCMETDIEQAAIEFQDSLEKGLSKATA